MPKCVLRSQTCVWRESVEATETRSAVVGFRLVASHNKSTRARPVFGAPRHGAPTMRDEEGVLMGIKWRRSKKRSDEDADDVKVEVDLMTGAMRIDPHKLLRSKAMRELLHDAKELEDQILERRSD